MRRILPETNEEGARMDFICKECSKRKGPMDEWLIVLEFEKPRTGIRNMVILAEWDDKRAFDPRAVHFCSITCQKAYGAEHYGRVLVGT